MDEPRCISLSLAARRLDVSVSTLARWIKAGRGPTVTRLEGRVLIRTDHLLRWLDSRASDAGQRAA